MPRDFDAPTPGRMPTTKWTLIARIREGDEKAALDAISDLCNSYHYPLYCCIRRHGLNHHDAEDALHEFLAKLLRNDTFGAVDSEKGRLRSFLLVALKRFLANWNRDVRTRREVELSAVSEAMLEVANCRYDREGIASAADNPDALFDRQWTRELVRLTLKRLRRRYAERGRAHLFEALVPVLESGGSLADHDSRHLAEQLSMRPGALRTALHRLLREYREELEEQVADTVGDRRAAREELEALAKAFFEV